MPYTEAAIGAGGDVGFAGESAGTSVLEGFGPVGYGFHSPDEEYIDLDSIPLRLYVLVRTIMEIATA